MLFGGVYAYTSHSWCTVDSSLHQTEVSLYPQIAESISHPLYDSTTVDNDVALLRLPQPLDYTPYLAPVCLPSQGEHLPVGQLCTIIGWGKERNTHLFGTDVLHQAEVRLEQP